jgi:ABC-2 type transport system permease protein
LLLFLLSLILAWGLRFLWGYWLALLAFWFTRADALLALQDSLVFIFSGMIAPVSLLPGFLQDIAKFIPFRYMVGFPVEIFTNQLSWMEIGQGLIMQSIWLVVSFTLCSLLWKNGLRRYSAIGG